jgi:hypothetical protein
MAMRNFFSHWRVLLALFAAIVLAIFTFRGEPAHAAPPVAKRLRLHALGIAAEADYAQAALAAYGYKVRHQYFGIGTYSASTTEATLANVAPGAQAERVFIVGSRYAAGDAAAEEDCTGAAAVLALAGLLRHVHPAAGTEIRFVLFSAPHVVNPGSFVAFIGTRAASAPVRQALAAFRDDAVFLAGGIAAPSYLQATTLATHSAASGGALLIADTDFARYPFFRAGQSEAESEYDGMARVVTGLAQTLSSLAGAPSG